MDTLLKKSLKAQAHHLKPVVLLGAKGLTDAVLAETDLALTTHELIKVKVKTEKEDRLKIAESLATALEAAIVQMIGHTVILYRKNEE